MEVGAAENFQIHRYPQSKYVDSLRWLTPLSAFERYIVLALHDSDSDSSSIDIHSLNRSNPQNLNFQSSWTSPSRISSLKVSQTPNKPLIAASSFAGSLHILVADAVDASLVSELSLADGSLHVGPISGIDLQGSGVECVTVDEDGRVNLARIGDSGLNYCRVFDSRGLVSYTTVKWGSPVEFATGGYGFGLQWWDQRKPGGAVSQFKSNCGLPFDGTDGLIAFVGVRWPGICSGFSFDRTDDLIARVDVEWLGLEARHQESFIPLIFIPSRKHICVAGGSSGTIFAWDLRFAQQPILLTGVGQSDIASHSPCDSEVWNVQYDSYMQSSNISSMSSSQILPVMMCSEDGILAVVEQGNNHVEVLAEPCAINSFDIDQQNPSDLICSFEWESIAFISRP